MNLWWFQQQSNQTTRRLLRCYHHHRQWTCIRPSVQPRGHLGRPPLQATLLTSLEANSTYWEAIRHVHDDAALSLQGVIEVRRHRRALLLLVENRRPPNATKIFKSITQHHLTLISCNTHICRMVQPS